MFLFSNAWSKAKGIPGFISTKFSQIFYFFSNISYQAILYLVRGVEPLIGYVRYNFTPLVALVVWQILKDAIPSSRALHYAYRYQKNVVDPFYNSTWMLYLAAKMEKVISYLPGFLLAGDVMLLNLGAAMLLVIVGLCIEPIGTMFTLGIRVMAILQSIFLPFISIYSLMRFVPLKVQYTNILRYQNISEENDFLAYWDAYIKIGISVAVVLMAAVNPFGKTIGHYFALTVYAHNAFVIANHMRQTDAAYHLAFIPLLANLMFSYVSVIRLLPVTLKGIRLARPAIPVLRVACSLRKLTLAIPDSGYNRQVEAR